ncbi:MAG: radical SAM protein [Acidobacteria bacterium]|nr:radical SAM protein [Acidobacteriota bacterium]
MKVLLVNPSQVRLVQKKGRIYARRWPPLDLATTAAALEREGVTTDVIDGNAEGLAPSELAARARGYDKIFVTSTSLDRWQCPHLDLRPFLATVEALRPLAPELYVLGSHGTVRPAEMLEATGATAVVRGEPERTVVELAAGGSLAATRGLTWRDGDRTVHNPEQAPVKLDELPLPAFHKLPMERYSYEVLGDRFSLFEMSRGCASNCNFCLLETYGVGVRKKSVDTLAREVEHAVKNFGVKTAYFIDLEFTVLRKQALEFSDWLARQSYDFRWCCQTRFDLVNPDMLRQMKRAGCRLIHFGVEAGSEELLDWTNKKITMRQIEDGMRMVKEAGIESACFFIFGFPGARQKEMDDIYRFAVKLNPTYALFHVAAPYPGTALYEQVKNDPNVRFSDDTLFPEAIEGPLTVSELKRMTRTAYLKYYTRPSYLLSRLGKGEVRALWNQANLFWQFVRA